MKRANILWVSVLLASCSSAPIFSLAPSGVAGQGAQNFVLDDTRYYKGKGPIDSYKIESELFLPSPKYVLDARLADILTDPDAEKVRLKMISVYLVYSRLEVEARSAMGLGLGVGGAAGMAVFANAQAQLARSNLVTEDISDRQTIMCDFLARYKGRIIEFKIKEPACSGQVRICAILGPASSQIFEAPEIRQRVEAVTQACIGEAISRIDAMKDLPPLAEVDQEAR
jgi:hypothetical protein